MSPHDDRIDELIAAAVADQLTPSERVELDRLRSEHAWIDDEIASLGAIDARLRGADVAWEQPTGVNGLRERILGQIPSQAPAAPDAPDAPVDVAARRTRRRWIAPLVGAACLVVGLVIGLGAPALTSLPPTGPPGTLGAIEPIDVRDEVSGMQVDADLVAHTWGTEAVLDATGLEVGGTYSIVFIGEDGTEFSAGEMLGSEVPIHCRVNAAVMREDAVRLEIRDADATLVALAELPSV